MLILPFQGERTKCSSGEMLGGGKRFLVQLNFFRFSKCPVLKPCSTHEKKALSALLMEKQQLLRSMNWQLASHEKPQSHISRE
jgi:hypothetical protein